MSSTLDRPVPIIHSHTGIRGIAAMCVFLAHLCEFYQGWGYDLIGVQLLFRQEYALDLFFILSGFILNWVYLSNRSTFNWPSYLKARVARIMPLYYLTTGICFSIHFNNFFGNSIYQCWKNKALIILSNALLLSGVLGGWNMTLNGPAWSISVEFFCYLALFPILLVINGLLMRNRIGLPVSVLLVVFLTHCLVISYHAPPILIHHWNWDSANLARGVSGFSLGFLLCTIFRLGSKVKPHASFITLLISVCVVGFFLAEFCFPPNVIEYLLPLVVFFTAYDLGFSAILLNLEFVQWLGERSYSIYLWHSICLTVFTQLFRLFFQHAGIAHMTVLWAFIYGLFVVTGVLVISNLSYGYFEQPCRDFIRKFWKIKNPSFN